MHWQLEGKPNPRNYLWWIVLAIAVLIILVLYLIQR